MYFETLNLIFLNKHQIKAEKNLDFQQFLLLL